MDHDMEDRETATRQPATARLRRKYTCLPTTCQIQRVRGHLVVDGCIGTVNARGYFYCNEPSCPFSLKLNKRGVGRGSSYDSIQALVFPHHLHEMKTNTRIENKLIIADMLKDIDERRDVRGSLANQYNQWQTHADVEMKLIMDTLIHDVATITYSCKHPDLSGQEIKDRAGSSLSRQGINSARIQEFRRTVCVVSPFSFPRE